MSNQTRQPMDDKFSQNLLRYAIAALVIGPLATLLALGSTVTDAPVNYLGPLLFLSVGLVGWTLVARGKYSLAVPAMVYGACAAITAIAVFTGGVRSPAVVVYPVLILVFGWLSHARAAIGVALLISVLTLMLWAAENLGRLPLPFQASPLVYMLQEIITYVLSAALLVFILKAYNRQLTALKESERRHRNMIEWTPEAILVHRETQILYANPAAVKLFGAPDAATLVQKTTTELIHPDSLSSQISRMQLIQSGEPLPATTEARFLRLDGAAMDVEVQGIAIEFDGAPAIQVSIHDITERKHMELEIRQLAFYDTLTGLPNRRLLSDRLAQAIAANQRSGCYCALMFLDLDNFKPLNDTHGHSVGDQLLIEAARRIAGCLRQMDTVARFGGDEFIVLLTELETDLGRANHGAYTVASKIRDALAVPYPLQIRGHNTPDIGLAHRCTVSMGVVVFASAHAHEDDLTRWADTAMYQAKSEGRDRICLYQPPLAAPTNTASSVSFT